MYVLCVCEIIDVGPLATSEKTCFSAGFNETDRFHLEIRLCKAILTLKHRVLCYSTVRANVYRSVFVNVVALV